MLVLMKQSFLLKLFSQLMMMIDPIVRSVPGEDGVEGSAPGTDLQGEEGDCVEEDGPVSPSERGCASAAKEDEDAEGTDEEDEEEASPPTPPPSATSRLNPTILRDTGPPDR